ncbi:MAG TPA: hypothetical protein VGH84_15920 [Steroidobacteraceae bacterium]
MANEALDSFLASEAQEATQTPAPQAPSEAPPAASEPKAEPKPTAESKATPEPSEDAEPPQPLDGEPVIPRRAYEDERRKRQDWKEKAARLEGENAAMRRQMEEAQRPQPQPMPPLAAIDPVQDPAGYHLRLQQVMLNERLNNSELMLREKIGDDKVTEYVNDFKQMAQADQTLFGKLYSQVHPYNWMVREVDRLRMLRDVGDDPAAYRTKIEAEARAKWDAEAAAKPAPVSPAAGMQPSLATARSVAGRTASTWSGEPSLEDVLAPVQNRKKPNGNGSVRY